MSSKNVGMIGLGLMGTALTERLLAAGYAVNVFNRTREKADPLIARGACCDDNPLASCDRVIISLYTTDTVEEVLVQLDSGLHAGQILIDTTTGSPAQTAAVGERHGRRGVAYLDAPISVQTSHRSAAGASANARDCLRPGETPAFPNIDDRLPGRLPGGRCVGGRIRAAVEHWKRVYMNACSSVASAARSWGEILLPNPRKPPAASATVCARSSKSCLSSSTSSALSFLQIAAM